MKVRGEGGGGFVQIHLSDNLEHLFPKVSTPVKYIHLTF